MSSKPPATTEPSGKVDSKNVRATITGLDNDGQLFRDSARIISLKGQKCVYVAPSKPSRDGSVLIEMRIGGESWRSDAKIRSVSSSVSDPGSFQVTAEMDRASSVVVEAPEPEPPPPPAPKFESKVTPPPDPVENIPPSTPDARQPVPAFAPPASYAMPELPGTARKTPPLTPDEEMPLPAPVTPPVPVAPAMPAFPAASADPRASARSAPASRTAIAEVVRSVLAAEVAEWKQDLPDLIAGQIEAALRHPLERLEAKVDRQLRKQPALTEDFVRKAAIEAAERTQIEWSATSQDMIAETVRTAVSADGQQQRRELRRLVAGEMEAALRGTLTARIDARANEIVDARMDESLHTHPPMTEETVRQLATEAAEAVQIRWASTRLQNILAEIVRSTVAAESDQRRAEAGALSAEKLDQMLGASLEGRIGASLEKLLADRIDQYLQSPAAAEALRSAFAAASPVHEEDSINPLFAAPSDRSAPNEQVLAESQSGEDRSGVPATEALTSQVIADLQQRLNSFSAEMSQLLSKQGSQPAAKKGKQVARLADEKSLVELLQSAGSNFEREIEEVLEKTLRKRSE